MVPRARKRGAGADAVEAWAPGRVNLIGEHTDYAGGLVLPIAVDRRCRVRARRIDGRKLRLRSREIGDEVELPLDDLRPSGRWSDYPAGVVAQLERAGARVPGAELSVESEIPPGGGLSSSAALELATALSLLELAGASLEPVALARLCQRAEHEFAGARCGVMDQLACLCAREGHALLIDCRSLEGRSVRLPSSLAVVVVDSGVRHSLAAGEYNRRREECEEATRRLARARPGISSLRDLSPAALLELRDALPDCLRRRARHVVTENARVLAAAEALERDDRASLGALLAESHASLARDYEVSSPELDSLVAIAAGAPGVVGSRMTGGGFGGCTVHLVAAERAERFAEHVVEAYARAWGRAPGVHVCRAVAGPAAGALERPATSPAG